MRQGPAVDRGVRRVLRPAEISASPVGDPPADGGLSNEQTFDAALAQALRTIAESSKAAAIEALVHAQRLVDVAERDELRAEVAEMRLRRRA